MDQLTYAPDIDTTLHYKPTHQRQDGHCRLRVWHDRHVAMVTETEDNPGMSVTNAAEDVWSAARRHLGVELDHPSWWMVEHYPACPGRRVPTFDVVTFAGRDAPEGRFRGPTWMPGRRVPELAWLYDAAPVPSLAEGG
jgi:hypothetical protein